MRSHQPARCAEYLGLNSSAAWMLAWDAFDAVLTPSDLILIVSWRTKDDARSFEHTVFLPEGGRLLRKRVVLDHGMFDREAPQFILTWLTR